MKGTKNKNTERKKCREEPKKTSQRVNNNANHNDNDNNEKKSKQTKMEKKCQNSPEWG